MANLNSTTLTVGVEDSTDRSVQVASIATLSKGDLVVVVNPSGLATEAMTVEATPIAGTLFVKVMRGTNGTTARRHQIGSTLYTGKPHQFYSYDPHGIPLASPNANPWINLASGAVWFAEGESVGADTAGRFWQLLTPTYSTGVFGVPRIDLAPTS